MIIDEINSILDVEFCVDMYLQRNDESFMPANRDISIQSLHTRVRRKSFVRVLRDNGLIIAWIYCEPIQLLHMNTPNFQQIYFCSNQTGVKAYKCVTLLHDEMYNFAKKDYKFCVSPGNHLDANNTFTKILERHGWTRRGYLALKEGTA